MGGGSDNVSDVLAALSPVRSAFSPLSGLGFICCGVEFLAVAVEPLTRLPVIVSAPGQVGGLHQDKGRLVPEESLGHSRAARREEGSGCKEGKGSGSPELNQKCGTYNCLANVQE